MLTCDDKKISMPNMNSVMKMKKTNSTFITTAGDNTSLNIVKFKRTKVFYLSLTIYNFYQERM